jgi:hypothetical protein
MNIHEAIKNLKAGKPIHRPSGDRPSGKEVVMRLTNDHLGLILYGSKTLEETGEEYYYSFNKTTTFSIEDIEATDWEIYTPEEKK